MDKDKMKAKSDYINMIQKSWTYNRMTDKEKSNCIKALSDSNIFGSYKQRYEILHNVYTSFLYALEYNDFCAGWREPVNNDRPLF